MVADTSLTKYTGEIVTQLNFINKSFVQGDMRSSKLLGNVNVTTDNINTEFTDATISTLSDFVIRLLKGYKNGNFTSVVAINNTVFSPKKLTSSGYVLHTDDGLLGAETAAQTNIVLNLSSSLTTSSDFLSRMNELVALYHVLDKVKYSGTDGYLRMNSSSSISLNQYTLTESNLDSRNFTKSQIDDLLKVLTNTNDKLVFNSDTDIVTVRRLLRLYIILGNFMIACKLLESASEATPSTNKEAARKTLNSVYDELVLENRMMIQDNSADPRESISDVTNSLTNKMKDYRKYTASIDILDRNVKDLKAIMKNDVLLLENTTATYSVTQRIGYVSLATFIVILVGAVAAFVYPDPSKQKLIAGITLLMAIVIAIVMYMVVSYKLEPFVGSAASSISGYYNANKAIITENIIELISISMFDGVINYLESTIRLALVLNTNQSYTNINNAVMKERNTYMGIHDQMRKGVNELESKKQLLTLEHTNLRSRILLFIFLMVIIGSATFISHSVPDLKNATIGVATVLIVILLIGFVISTQMKVRTRPRQLYWQAPSNSQFL